MDATRLPTLVVARAQETLVAVLEQEAGLVLSGDLHSIEGRLHSVTVASTRLITAGQFRATGAYLTLH